MLTRYKIHSASAIQKGHIDQIASMMPIFKPAYLEALRAMITLEYIATCMTAVKQQTPSDFQQNLLSQVSNKTFSAL